MALGAGGSRNESHIPAVVDVAEVKIWGRLSLAIDDTLAQARRATVSKPASIGCVCSWGA